VGGRDGTLSRLTLFSTGPPATTLSIPCVTL
jgi:hypothetical protein